MSIATDSRVVDALQQPENLERLLRALRCDTSSDRGPFNASGSFIHCPMPDHPDKHESCSVLADLGVFECRSVCGTIRPMDLVVAHGYAADRAAAAVWIEQELGIERAPLEQLTVVQDPSLSVRQYLALKHLSDDIARDFDLRDVRVYENAGRARKGYSLLFESGFHGAVLMPNDPPGVADTPANLQLRPRVRNIFGARWPAKVQFPRHAALDRIGGAATQGHGGRPGYGIDEIQFSRDLLAQDDGTSSSEAAAQPAHRQRAYGIPQLRAYPPDAMLSRTLLVLEGESDVHALHDMGLTQCIGMPGAQSFRSNIADIIEAIERLEPGILASGQLTEWTVLVWQEPGSAGSKFPGAIADSLTQHCMGEGLPVPRTAALLHSSIEIPTSALDASVVAHPKDPCDVVARLVPLHRGNAAAARTQGAGLLTSAAFQAAGRGLTAEVLDPAAPPVASAPATAVIPEMPALTSPLGEDPWEGMDTDGHLKPPDPVLTPRILKHLGATFVRTSSGWAHEGKDAEGDTVTSPVTTIFDVLELHEIDGEDHVVLRAPRTHTQEFQTVRVHRGDATNPVKLQAVLGSIGVTVAMRKGPQAAAIVQALADNYLRQRQIIRMPATTGWTGVAGTGAFGGIDAEPLCALGARMYQSNLHRRASMAEPDEVRAAAAEWFERGAAPLISIPPGCERQPSIAAPLLALGAAAAAPLIGPLNDVGVNVAPVVWIAGLGGGGKSLTQLLCASIFAPSAAANDGQIAYSANANISQAALGARVDSCRDLPLILDDVTQLPPNPGSQLRGDDARIEAAAMLGMQIFNRKPIERATREGGMRLTRPFRSSAIFSAEVSMSSGTTRAMVTAGQRRRVATIEAKPMTERGLTSSYAETVNYLSARLGGAPADLLIPRVRELTTSRKLKPMFVECLEHLNAMPEAATVTQTQRQALAMGVMGFALLAEVCAGWTLEQSLAHAAALLRPYFAVGAVAGGATHDEDLSGRSAAVDAVSQMITMHTHRFDMVGMAAEGRPIPQAGWLGRILRPEADGTRRVVLYTQGLSMIQSSMSISQQQIAEAIADGSCRPRFQFRDDEQRRQRGTLFRIPEGDGPTDDDDPEHDPDPHGLRPPAPADEPVHVPGAVEQSIESVASDMLAYYTRAGQAAPIQGGTDMSQNIRFTWGAEGGYYVVTDATAVFADAEAFGEVAAAIRADVNRELDALRGHYENAALIDPEQQLGAPIEVADFPAEDDPNWERITGLGWERARKQWAQHYEALWRANHTEDLAAAREHHAAHVKHMRVHLMARLRHPEWFIVGEDQLAATA